MMIFLRTQFPIHLKTLIPIVKKNFINENFQNFEQNFDNSNIQINKTLINNDSKLSKNFSNNETLNNNISKHNENFSNNDILNDNINEKYLKLNEQNKNLNNLI